LKKKTAASKRAALPRAADYASSFLKDWQRLSRSGRYDMNRLRHVMLLLIGGETLGPEWSDHALTGNWKGFRECHIGGDFLLIYRLEDSGKHELIVFVRAGTHAELFE
jgi:mRNA interferase YafQ